MGDIRIGISGWRYPPWRGTFYPKGLAQHNELAFASRTLPSIEINGSFYALQRPSSYESWYAETPDDFIFSVKAPRYVTHILRLRDVETPIANFFASGIFELKQKLGPILWQFPPSFRFNAQLFEKFLAMLPHDTDQALALARQYDSHLKGRVSLTSDASRVIRHAVEIRNASFVEPTFVELLRHYRVALVVADTAGKWPYQEDVTTDFMYLRLHGAEELYTSGYTDAALDRWSRRIADWSKGSQPGDAHLITRHKPQRQSRDIFCYFDNDVKVKAPFDASQLLARLHLPHPLLQPDARILPEAERISAQNRRKTSLQSKRKAPAKTGSARNRSRARSPSGSPPASPPH